MSDQTLFSDNNNSPEVTPQQQETPNQNSQSLFADQLAGIKNESGEQKYDTPEKALEALKHSQQYIPQLKQELASKDEELKSLKEKLEAANKVEDIVNQQTSQPNGSDQQTLGEQDIESIVAKVLGQSKTAEVQSANEALVNKALSDKFGAGAQVEVAKKAAELGMKPSELGALAKKNPKAALALFGQSVGTPSPITGGYNIAPEPNEPEPLGRPDKSLLRGSTAKDQAEFMRKVREEVYRKYNITE